MKPLPRDRTFGFFLTVLLVVIGFRLHKNLAMFLTAAFVLSVSLIYPLALRPLNRVWYQFGIFLGRFVSPVVLFVLYFLVFSPMALVIKAIGHKPFKPPGWVLRSKPCRFEKPF